MGLTVSVYRSDMSDCTNNGISSKAVGLCLVNVSGPFGPSDAYPAAILTTNGVGNPVIKPAVKNDDDEWIVAPGWWMNGGNLAATSDSRFGEAVSKMSPGFYGALYIHDRKEF
jgi:hypothetical protein